MEKPEIMTADFSPLRLKAEKLLKNRALKKVPHLYEIDTLRLIHELEVHQIELEMQNEELLLTQAYAAELATEKYAELYDFVPSAFFTLSREGKIVGLNISGSQMLGQDRMHLINSLLGIFVSEDTRPVFDLFLGRIFKSRTKETCEVTLSVNSALPMYVFLTGIFTENVEQCLVTMVDITDSKSVEIYGEMTREILQILNDPGDLKDSLHHIINTLETKNGFDAVGIRLQEGDDFPFFDQNGFSENFLLTENSLVELAKDGKACRDNKGCVRLECTCGLVISGKADQANPFFTPGGSWWTNDSFPLLNLPSEKDDRFHPRNQCIRHGYNSVAIVPIRSKNRIVGLVQFNDLRKGRITRQMMEFFEGVASHIGSALIRKQAEFALNQLNEELEDRVKERTSELLYSNNTLRETKEKYRTVADFAYNWEFWTDQDDLMVYCSPSCERITGYKASDFVQNSRLLFDIIHPGDLKDYMDHKKEEQMVQDANFEFQYRIIRSDGSVRWIGHICQPIFDEWGNFIGSRGSNKDITKRRYMEKLLRVSNHKYELLSENISDGIFICKDGCFEYVNKALNHIFGYQEHKLEGLKLIQLALPDYANELEEFLKLSGKVNQNRNIEIECFKKDDSIIFVEILLNYVASEKAIYGVVHDITEKKQVQKSIIKAIIHTEEKERTHFSKELHDGLGPLLSTIKLYLQWSGRPKTNKSREEIIHKAEDILEEALVTVKEISYRLSPHLLTYYGLTSAIQSFVDKLEESSTIEINFESNSDRRFELAMETTIYRAVIECINNTIKHSGANKISISLNDTGKQIQLQYADNGMGYNLNETLAERRGLGLFNLQSRIQSIGGKIILFSEPGQGVNYQIIVNI